MPNLCNAATCAKFALNKAVCDAVASAALNFYSQIVEFIRNTLCFDISILFQVIAVLAVICWVQEWLLEIIKFICKIPKIIKNLFCGKFNLCLLDCDSEHSTSSKHSKHSERSESEDY